MPRANYGPEVKKRAKRLVEGLLLYANYELEGSDSLPIPIHWQTERRLVVRTKLRYLESLTALDRHYGKLTGSEIKEALTRLKDLALLEDNRVATQGAENWHFTLTVWQQPDQVDDNLRRLDELWEQRKQKRSPKSLPDPELLALIPIQPMSCQDWGEALNVATIYGRSLELDNLQRWVCHDRCRLVSILGMGGLGKTTLSVRFAEQVQEEFDRVIWRSLRNAPPFAVLLAEIIRFVATDPNLVLTTDSDLQIAQLLKYLRQHRCLIVLDNAESILQAGHQAGAYLPGYEAYGALFKAIGETQHESCLLLTSREKPSHVAWLEGVEAPVRSLYLTGLTPTDGQAIFTTKGCFGATAVEWQEIFNYYAGNPLALQIVAAGLQETSGGDAAELLPLLRQGRWQFQDISDLLVQQFERLSAIECQALYWLAINREPVSLMELTDDIVAEPVKRQLSAAIQSLSRRCLVERSGKLLSLQPVVMEYVTGELIARSIAELTSGEFNVLRDYALIKAQSKDYVRQSQIRFMLTPIVDSLLITFGYPHQLIQHLQVCLATFQQQLPVKTGYVAGNILNLLVYLQADLTGLDCRNLAVWQAHLVDVNLYDVDFSQTDVRQSVFKETLGLILSVTFSPDGNYFATTGADGDVGIWRSVDEQKIHTCQGHSNWVWSVRFSPNGQLLASGGDRVVKFWDVATGSCLRTLTGHRSWVMAVRFSPDGQILASASEDQTIKFWHVATGKCLRTLIGHTATIISIDFHPDGKTLVSCGDDHTMKCWDVQTGECWKTMQPHNGSVYRVLFNQDGTKLFSGGADYGIKLWEFPSLECHQTFFGHTANVLALAVSRADEQLFSSGRDGTIKIWDVSTGRCLQTLLGHRARVFAIALHPTRNLLISGSDDQTVRSWDTASGDCLRVLQGYSNGIQALSFSPDGQRLASASQDTTVRIWRHWGDAPGGWSSTDRRASQHVLKGHTSWVTAVQFSPDGRWLASCSDDHTMRLWDAATGECVTTLSTSEALFAIAFSADSRYLAIGRSDPIVELWDVQQRQVVRSMQGQTNRVWAIAFSPDGKWIATGSYERVIKIWEVSSGVEAQALVGHEAAISAVSFSPDGKQVLSSSNDGTVRSWNLKTGKCLRVFQRDVSSVMATAFDPSGQYIAAGSNQGCLWVWASQTGECLWQSQMDMMNINVVKFSLDGQWLLSSGQDGVVRVWPVGTWECVATFRGQLPYEGLKIAGVTGLTIAEQHSLRALGAI